MPLLIGPVLVVARLAGMSRLNVTSGYLNIVAPLVVMALGLGMQFVSLTLPAVQGVAKDETGLASALLNTINNWAAPSACRCDPPQRDPEHGSETWPPSGLRLDNRVSRDGLPGQRNKGPAAMAGVPLWACRGPRERRRSFGYLNWTGPNDLPHFRL